MISRNRQNVESARRPSAALIALGLLLAATFAFGGSARGDELGLTVLRPASAIALVFGLYLLAYEVIDAHKFWVGWFFAIVALTVAHLLPLPPMLWHRLPGRELAIEADILLSAQHGWRPISLSPELTRNALWSMMGPLACFVLMIQLRRWEVFCIFALLIILSLISGLVAVLQISQGPESPFYFYRITNFGSGVGFFANRNHHAVLLACLVPVAFGLACLAVNENKSRSRVGMGIIVKWTMALGAVFLFSLVMVTGSRAGLLLYGLALILTFIYSAASRKSAEFTTSTPRYARFIGGLSQRGAITIFTVIVVAAVFISGRADTLKRLTNSGGGEEARWVIFDPLVDAILHFMPVGSGIGTFDPVFRGFEKPEILAPTYWNHAHNDWAEVAMTGGAPALFLILIAIIWLVRHYSKLLANRLTRTNSELYSFIGGSVLVLTAVSSAVEYPLRVPIMTCVFAMAVALISKARLGAHS